MDLQILIGLLLTILPVFELRGGLPVIVEYVIRNNMSVWPWFFIVILLNIVVIFFIFLFLDLLHESLMNLKFYRRFMNYYLKRIRIKAHKLQDKMHSLGFIALILIVAIPLPGTGAWTGTLIAWFLGLNRLKSYISIAIGVIIAGFLVLGFSFGFFSSL